MHKLLSSCCEPFQTDVVVIPSGAVEWNQSPSTSHWHLSWQASETGCLFEGILRLFPDWKLTNSSKKLMVGRWHVLFKWSLFSGHVDFRWVYKVKYVWYHVRWWMHGPWSKDRTFEGSACKYTWMTCTYAFIFLFYSRISRQFCIWTRSEPTPSLHVILVSVCSWKSRCFRSQFSGRRASKTSVELDEESRMLIGLPLGKFQRCPWGCPEDGTIYKI